MYLDDVAPENGRGVGSLPTRENRTTNAPKENARNYTLYNIPEEIVYTPESALKEGLHMVEAIKDRVLSIKQGNKVRQEVWARDLTTLQSQGSPKTLIAVCGATGAGKSSILNAILDDNIVPTSGMRACTAVVTEISYHKKKTIDADVSFLTEAEWRSELKLLVEDLVDEQGNIKSVKNLGNEAGVAWSKVHAVYPGIAPERLGNMTVDQILGADSRINRILGATRHVEAKDSKTFGKEIAKFIDSKDQRRGNDKKKGTDKNKPKAPEKEKEKPKTMGGSLIDLLKRKAEASAAAGKEGTATPDLELWPLIKNVKVRCNARALETGAVLCDLPGTADANAARNSIAKNYMKNCNCVWILAPITRAVDDRTARDLMGDAFKTQLLSEYLYYDSSTITFIATKTDDVSCEEIIRSLHLKDDPELEVIEAALDDIDARDKVAKSQKTDAETTIEELANALRDTRAHIREYKDHIEALENGEPFTPIVTGPNGAKNAKKKAKGKGKSKTSGKKRKSANDGRKSSKRRRTSDDGDADEDDLAAELAEDSDADFDDDDISEADSLDDFIVDDSEDDDFGDKSDKEDAQSDGSSNAGNSDAEHDEDMDEPQSEVTVEDLKEKLKESREALKAGTDLKKDESEKRKEAINIITTLKKERAKLQRQKNGFCSLRRSEFSIDVLREDFRTGLKGMDDAAAEERDPDSFNPEEDLRDYASINLPVFTASARDYVRLKRQVRGDGDPICFSNVKDTGIPALQEWCRALTVASRERSARIFLHSIKVFANSVRAYLRAGEGVTAEDRQVLRDLYETRLADPMGIYGDAEDDEEDDEEDDYDEFGYPIPGAFDARPKMNGTPQNPKVVGITAQLATAFGEVANDCVRGLKEKFRDGLEDKCQVGAANAAASAVEVSDNIAGSMHWATYRATLRRNGSHRIDINEELATPMSKGIASSWGKVFESDLFASFQNAANSAITVVLNEVQSKCPVGLQERAGMQAEVSMNEAKLAMDKITGVVHDALQDNQKDVSRSLIPHVQSSMFDGYARAMEERGTGSVKRQKAVFHTFVDDHKHEIFTGGADIVMGRLNAAADAVGIALTEKLFELAEKVEVSISVLWEGGEEDPAQIRVRRAVVDHINEIIDQASIWLEAERLHATALEEESPAA
ncbi:hypothetical protein DL93DRAFT_2062306 [Clavulina sp. PMI_390]|nr:hypothetical protein DL93DRAFT_2062306 [Clavulina sp. PMI_390]